MIAITAPWMIKEETCYKYCSHQKFTQTTITFFNNQPDSFSTNPQRLVGGRNQEWKQLLENIGQQLVEQQHPHQDVEEMGEQKNVTNKKLDVEKIKNPYIIDPTQYHTQEELFNAIKHWWIFKYRKNEKTINDRLRYARNMAAHHVFPINWFDLNPLQSIAYLEYKEYQEYQNLRGKHQIINEWKTIKTFAKAFGINADLWGYIPPSPPKPKVQIVPLPNTTYDMIQHDYSKDLYKNALIQYILIHGFLIGWRPSELLIQKASDVFLDDGYLIITETKKNRQPRQIFPEPDLMTNLRRKSMKNWIEHWRPKVENQHSNDYLYLQPNGRPFTDAYLKKFLNQNVKPVWSYYHPYVMRHWCAIARLIKSKVDTKKWDIWEVKEWLGHDKVTTTEGYVQYAKMYYRNASYDWVKALLKFHADSYDMGQEKGLNSKTPLNTLVSTGNNRSEKVCSCRDSNPSRSLERAS